MWDFIKYHVLGIWLIFNNTCKESFKAFRTGLLDSSGDLVMVLA